MYFLELRELYDLADKKPPTEINLTLTGYRADEVLPEESGEYAVTLDYGSHRKFWTLSYSAKRRAWNVYDHSTDEEVAKWRIDEVTHWFRLPEAPALKGDTAHD